MSRLLLNVRILVLVLAASVLQLGQVGFAKDLTKVYQPDQVGDYAHQLYVEPNWVGSSGQFWYARESAQGRVYVLVDPVEKALQPLFDHTKLATALKQYGLEDVESTSLALEALQIKSDFTVLEFSLQNTAFTYELKSGTLSERAEREPTPGGISPDGKWRAFLDGPNLSVEDLETGEVRPLTDDGTEAQPYATALMNPRHVLNGTYQADWADIRWSWNSRYIATYRMDLNGVTQLTMPNGDETIAYHYPRAMDENVPLATPIVFDLKTGERFTPNIAPLPVLYYGGPRLRWVDDNNLMVTSVKRGYKNRTVYSYDVSSQKLRTVLQENSDRFVNIYEGTNWVIYDWDRLLWLSDIDGHTHIYLADLEGGEQMRQITEGAWRVAQPIDIVEGENEIYFLASGRREGVNPYYRALYRIKRFGSEPELLTPDEHDHSVYMSPDGAYIVDNISRVDMPTRSVLRRSRDGKIIMELGGADISPLQALGHRFPEPFSLATSTGFEVHGVLYRPIDFDETKQYPLIEQIYTGPHTSNAARSFNQGLKRSHAQAVANAGFIVLQLDVEGTEGRSRAFLDPAYKNLAEVGLDTRIEVIEALAEAFPQIDLNRVGAFGFSAGGYDVVRLLTRRPDFYKVGVAASGNYDSRWDKADWNEQWLGIDDFSVYEASSMLTSAHRLQGRLLLAHGLQDENVPVQATRELVKALEAAEKHDLFEVDYYPTGGHFLETDPAFVTRRLDFFRTHLGGPEPIKATAD